MSDFHVTIDLPGWMTREGPESETVVIRVSRENAEKILRMSVILDEQREELTRLHADLLEARAGRSRELLLANARLVGEKHVLEEKRAKLVRRFDDKSQNVEGQIKNLKDQLRALQERHENATQLLAASQERVRRQAEHLTQMAAAAKKQKGGA